jgi:hypothetical protein
MLLVFLLEKSSHNIQPEDRYKKSSHNGRRKKQFEKRCSRTKDVLEKAENDT